MFRLPQTMCLAVIAAALVACTESAPTAPQARRAAAATDDIAASPNKTPTATCTVTQVDATHYQATATWSNISPFEIQFRQGETVLASWVFKHAKKTGSVTSTVFAAPDNAIIAANPTGLKVLCSLS